MTYYWERDTALMSSDTYSVVKPERRWQDIFAFVLTKNHVDIV